MRGLVRSTGKFKKYSFKNNSHRAKLPLHDWKACEQAGSFCLGLFLVYNLIDGVGDGGARLHLYHSLLVFFFQSCSSDPDFPLAASKAGTCLQHINTEAILVGGEADKEIPPLFLSMLSLIILDCWSRRESNSHTEILSLHAFSSLLSSGVVKQAGPARHSVNDTVKRSK